MEQNINLELGGQTSELEALAYALVRCGACRESYYSGQLSGAPCSYLIRRMLLFCSLIFHLIAQNWNIVTKQISSMQNLKSLLKNVAMLNTCSNLEDQKSVEFYLWTQEKWTAKMTTDWDMLSSRLVTAPTDDIGREPIHGRALKEYKQWLQRCKWQNCIVFSHTAYISSWLMDVLVHFQSKISKISSMRDIIVSSTPASLLWSGKSRCEQQQGYKKREKLLDLFRSLLILF